MAGPGGLGLRDDAALLRPEPGHDQVITVDALVAGVHFFPDDPPDSIARKALRVNLSDLAAKGARPTGFVLAIALQADWTVPWLESFAKGLGDDATLYECPLLGGDTVKTPGPLTISITAFGDVPAGRMSRRTGARPGDALYVTGSIGDGALGLRLRAGERIPEAEGGLTTLQREVLIDRYLHPQPRVALRHAIVAHASGGMDISDGLVGDVIKMLHASGATGRVRLDRVPLSDAARRVVGARADLLETVVTGGDDYEILASIPAAQEQAFQAAAAAAGVDVTRIGDVLAGSSPPIFVEATGGLRSFPRASFSHF